MSFWKDEKCEYCGGKIVDRKVDLPKKVGNTYSLFKSVPAGVCLECGIRYFSANILKIIHHNVRLKKGIKKVLRVPVMSF